MRVAFRFANLILNSDVLLLLRFDRHEDQELQDWIKTQNLERYDEILLFQNQNTGINLDSNLEKVGWLQKANPIYPLMHEPHVLKLYAKY